MNRPILCRLGLHSWKPVFRISSDHLWADNTFPPARMFCYWPEKFPQIAFQCRRCGKRVSL